MYQKNLFIEIMKNEKYLDNENVSFEEIFLLYLRMNIYVNNFNLIYEGQPLSQTVERSKL